MKKSGGSRLFCLRMHRMSFLLVVLFLTFLNSRADVLVNQGGYDRDESKRCTVPGAEDETPFAVKKTSDNSIVFSGILQDQKGDFTDFKPDTPDEYYIEVEGHGKSFGFYIAPFFFHSQTARTAYQFFFDGRLGVDGIQETKWGGPSRDAGAWNRETFFEAMLYASNPSLFDRYDYEPDAENEEFSENGIPDLIDIMLFHADFCYKFRDTPPPGMKDDNWPRKYPLEQLAAACAAYHWFLRDKGWMSEETYNKYLDWCIENWSAYGMDEPQDFDNVDRVWTEAPGYRIIPNLCLKDVGKFESRFEGAIHLDFAVEEIERLATQIPGELITSDGEREYTHIGGCCGRDIPFVSLMYGELLAPGHIPESVKDSLRSYRDIEQRKCDNLWDYRRSAIRDTAWPLERDPYVYWSTAGMVSAYPSCAIATDIVLGEETMRPLAFSAIDYMFGRNPCNAHFCSNATDPEIGFFGADNDWVCDYGGGSGKLGGSRGLLNGAPWDLRRKVRDGVVTWEGDTPFPYNPEACGGYNGWKHCEAWAVYQRMLLGSVALSVLGRQKLSIKGNEKENVSPGDSVRISLYAALNVDWELAETAEVTLRGWWDKAYDSETITLTETGPATSVFEKVIPTRAADEAVPNNGILEVSKDEPVTVSYGYSIFQVGDTLTFDGEVSVLPRNTVSPPRVRRTQSVRGVAFSISGGEFKTAQLTVYSLDGRKVTTVHAGREGSLRLSADATTKNARLTSGGYLYQLDVFTDSNPAPRTEKGSFYIVSH